MRLQAVATGYNAALLPPGAPPPPDSTKALLYRTEIWGTPFCRALQDVMRGRSEWSVAERELLAAYVSRKNQCPW